MLYGTFRAIMMFCGSMGIIYMIDQNDYTFIIFPIASLIWGWFSFFDPEDREYLRRNGINPDEFSAFFPDYGYYADGSYNPSSHHISVGSNHHKNSWGINNNTQYNHSSNNGYNYDYERYAPHQTTYCSEYNDRQYKGMSKKCKRSFKITVNTDDKK